MADQITQQINKNSHIKKVEDDLTFGFDRSSLIAKTAQLCINFLVVCKICNYAKKQSDRIEQ